MEVLFKFFFVIVLIAFIFCLCVFISGVFDAFKKNELSVKNKECRRSGVNRRIFSYDAHIPEYRSGKERREG